MWEAASEVSCGASSYAPSTDDDMEGAMLGGAAADQVAHLLPLPDLLCAFECSHAA